jgi:hypothetical protein
MPPPSPTVSAISRISPEGMAGLIHLTNLGSGLTAVRTRTRSFV